MFSVNPVWEYGHGELIAIIRSNGEWELFLERSYCKWQWSKWMIFTNNAQISTLSITISSSSFQCCQEILDRGHPHLLSYQRCLLIQKLDSSHLLHVNLVVSGAKQGRSIRVVVFKVLVQFIDVFFIILTRHSPINHQDVCLH